MLFFFDVTVNGRAFSDTIGSNFGSFEQMRSEALHSLMAIAKDEATENDHQKFGVDVRNSEGAVYCVTVSLQGGVVGAKN